MKLKIAAAIIVSINAIAENTVYGSVSELITRSGDKTSGPSIYFRLNLINPESSTIESCMSEGDNITWYIDVSTPIIDIQYQMLKESYKNKTYLHLSGQDDVCANGDTSYDNVFEISTW